MPTFEITPGARALKSFLEDHQISPAQAATQMGTTRTAMFYWLTGRLRPKPKQQKKIERWTKGKVTPDLWFTDSEQAEISETKPFQASEEHTNSQH